MALTYRGKGVQIPADFSLKMEVNTKVVKMFRENNSPLPHKLLVLHEWRENEDILRWNKTKKLSLASITKE